MIVLTVETTLAWLRFAHGVSHLQTSTGIGSFVLGLELLPARTFADACAYIHKDLRVYTHNPSRIYTQPFTYIHATLHVYTRNPSRIYTQPFTYIRSTPKARVLFPIFIFPAPFIRHSIRFLLNIQIISGINSRKH